MIKRLFEYLALSVLAVLGLAKLKGKRVNPVALRVLLAIFSFMAYCLDSTLVLLYSGTWLLFLLAGDLGRIYGYDLTLFVPVAAETAQVDHALETVEAENISEIAAAQSGLQGIKQKCAAFFSSFKR